MSKNCVFGHEADQPASTSICWDATEGEIKVTRVIDRENRAANEWDVFFSHYINL